MARGGSCARLWQGRNTKLANRSQGPRNINGRRAGGRGLVVGGRRHRGVFARLLSMQVAEA